VPADASPTNEQEKIERRQMNRIVFISNGGTPSSKLGVDGVRAWIQWPLGCAHS
jgi:hypothetical protein